MPITAPRTAGPTDTHIGKMIRERRTECGLSQSALAERLGVTFQQIQKYESGRNRVSAVTLHEIAKAVGYTVGSFYPEEPEYSGLGAWAARKAMKFAERYPPETMFGVQTARTDGVLMISIVAPSGVEPCDGKAAKNVQIEGDAK